MRFNDQGEELPDPTPVEVPANFKEPESLQSMIARLVNTHVSQAAARHGFETVEEANDFEVSDDEFPETKYEVLGDERLEEQHQAIVDARAARRYAARARRNAGSPGQAASTKRADSQHESPGPVRDDVGERGPPGERHLARGQNTEGGSAQTHEGRRK